MKTLTTVCSILIAVASIVAFLYQDAIVAAALNESGIVATFRDSLPTDIATLLFPTSSEPETSASPTNANKYDSEKQKTESFSPEGTLYDSQNTPLEVTNMSVPRAIKKVFKAVEQLEGAGATVLRSVGTPYLKNFTPFLMCDHFTIKPGAGFPDHPHRGQETITYLLSGAVDHEDFTGSKGTIEAGSLQFMTAGRGIVHAEMPNKNHAENIGIQLWVDLPNNLKGCEPRYRDLHSSEIPLATSDDDKVAVKVISGQSYGVDSVKDLAYTPVWLLDFTIQPGGKVEQALPKGWNSFLYMLEGTAMFGTGETKKEVGKFTIVVWQQEGDLVNAEVAEGAGEPGRFVLMAGQPMEQEVVQSGPFVASSNAEVYKAWMDYQSSSNGFERAEGWQSEIGRSMAR